jgi:hypothetical protein
MQDHEDIPYRVYDMVQSVFHAWTRTPNSELNSASNQIGFLHADRLLKLYDMVVQKPLIRIDAMSEWGKALDTRDQAFRQAYKESLRKRSKGRKKGKYTNDNDYHSGSMMADHFVKKASAADTLKEMQTELDATLSRLSREDEGEGGGGDRNAVPVPSSRRLSTLVASSPLAKMRIGSSTSTKLNYIINEVSQLSRLIPKRIDVQYH